MIQVFQHQYLILVMDWDYESLDDIYLSSITNEMLLLDANLLRINFFSLRVSILWIHIQSKKFFLLDNNFNILDSNYLTLSADQDPYYIKAIWKNVFGRFYLKESQ